jgi:hypothetical protein
MHARAYPRVVRMTSKWDKDLQIYWRPLRVSLSAIAPGE